MGFFTLRMELPQLQKEKFLKALDTSIQFQMREGIRHFARTALLNIPIQSGFVRGSFIPLRDLVKGLSIDFSGRNKFKEYYHGILKTPESGASRVTNEQIITKVGLQYYFNYNVAIDYFQLEDTIGKLSPTAPWQSFEKGAQAFVDYILKNGIKFIPRINDYLVKIVIEVK